MCDMIERRLWKDKYEHDWLNNRRTGVGRCSLRAAMRSPGASNATTGAPNVEPSKEANAPPKLCPMTVEGVRECARHEESTRTPYISIGIHVGQIIVQVRADRVEQALVD